MDTSRFLPEQSPLHVSVVLPVFDGEHHVADAVRSALSQTGVELDVVVVDDGSSMARPRISRPSPTILA